MDAPRAPHPDRPRCRLERARAAMDWSERMGKNLTFFCRGELRRAARPSDAPGLADTGSGLAATGSGESLPAWTKRSDLFIEQSAAATEDGGERASRERERGSGRAVECCGASA